MRSSGPRTKSASDTSKREVAASLALAAEATLETMVAIMEVTMAAAAIVDSKTMATSTKGATTMAVVARTTTATVLMATKDTINSRLLVRMAHKCPAVTVTTTNIRTTTTAMATMETTTTTLAAKWAANSNRAGIRSDADSAAAVGSEYDDC